MLVHVLIVLFIILSLGFPAILLTNFWLNATRALSHKDKKLHIKHIHAIKLLILILWVVTIHINYW